MSGPSDSPVRGTQALAAEFSPRSPVSSGDRSDMRGQASNVPLALPTSTVSSGEVVQRNSGNQDRADVSWRDGSDRATGGSVRRRRSDSNDRGRSGNDRYRDSARRGESEYDSDEEFRRSRRERSQGVSERRRYSPSSRRRPFNWRLNVPKGLSFSGEGEKRDVWFTYAHQLESFVNNYDLGKTDAKQVLFHTLTDKALNFASRTATSKSPELDYDELIAVLSRRFGRQLRPEEAHLRLQNASQKITENLDEWADRVENLARQAAGSSMTCKNSMMSVAIMRFCLGCRDKRAGQKTYEQGPPESLSEAIDKVEWFQHIKEAADRSCKEDWADQEFRARPSVRWADERPGRYSPDTRYSRVASPEHLSSRDSSAEDTRRERERIHVKAVEKENLSRKIDRFEESIISMAAEKENMSKRMDRFEERMDRWEENISKRFDRLEKLVAQLAVSPQAPSSRNTVTRNRGDSPRAVSRSRSPSPGVCFGCGKDGHFKVDCPLRQNRYDGNAERNSLN